MMTGKVITKRLAELVFGLPDCGRYADLASSRGVHRLIRRVM